MPILRYFLTPSLSKFLLEDKKKLLNSKISGFQVQEIDSEFCFYIEVERSLNGEEIAKLEWLLKPDGCNLLKQTVMLPDVKETAFVLEVGPRLNFSTAFSTCAVSMCNSVNLPVTRMERSTRYLVKMSSKCPSDTKSTIIQSLYDKMTECIYDKPLESFSINSMPESWGEVDILGKGKAALSEINTNSGLGMDDQDLEYYTRIFTKELKKNPTTVECFDLAQSNSEHSRHWFFKGILSIDGEHIDKNLFRMIQDTQNHSNQNNVIKFSDNSSAIKGYNLKLFRPVNTNECSYFKTKDGMRHIIFTAETHNFPTGVAPFSGATTGTGGRIRDVQAAGKGSHVIAGTAGYSFGNLNIPDYNLPWEDCSLEYPSNFAPPVEIAVEASNGASDYGNKFGEPIVQGFARSFGMVMDQSERREYIKPIMFTGGIGSIDADQITKEDPKAGMLVVKIGGPVYRIGVGGGAASSIHVQGDQREELDFGAVQRGDPEMEQKLNRVVRACIEQSDRNIICSIHDQGAGGNGNVLKEIVDPVGAVIYAEEFQLGDPTISILELWAAEYQESNAILIDPKDRDLLQQIGDRERCHISFVGEVNNTGDVVLIEKRADKQPARHPVDLKLSSVLGSVPAKRFDLMRQVPVLKDLVLPSDLTLADALKRVLRLPSVASKRYLTNKVDRSVTGLIAQQQCVGPLHTPLADVAVIALSHFNTVGSAMSIGEQPVKGLIDPAAGARMSVAEAVTNLVFAKVSCLEDVKCSGNWMWAAKLPGEGAALYDACRAMCDVMQSLGIAVDGGKDSLSMAARVQRRTVKAPGTLVVSAYAPCPDIRLTVTPDLKVPEAKGVILHVDMSGGNARLGGTALAHCYGQLGRFSPDLDYPELLKKGFEVMQDLITAELITAGHDVSDGGLVVCLLEMAFAGNCGLNVDIATVPGCGLFETLFNEEVCWIIEVREQDAEGVLRAFDAADVPCRRIGTSTHDPRITISVAGKTVLENSTADLRDVWEETSFQLELRQMNNVCAREERKQLQMRRKRPQFKTTFSMEGLVPRDIWSSGPEVAVIREEGINGDREMHASLFMAGLNPFDVTMTDLTSGRVQLSRFRGVVFPGGFSYADVLGSARGWAASSLFHPQIKAELDAFKQRPDTFSLGVCNGCQLMALLGWVGVSNDRLSLAHNISERFESRFVTVKIQASPAIMLRGMQGSDLGVWVAHGEGRFQCQDPQSLLSKQLIPLMYVDDLGNPTTEYPMNPNGSPYGMAAVCSEDGRHLAMMPHPERCVLPWQWPYVNEEFKEQVKGPAAPWLKMFRNAYDWCNMQK